MATTQPTTRPAYLDFWGCPECGKPVERKSPKGPPPLFCSKTCKVACERRKLADGRAIVDLAKAWRISRNNKAHAQIGGASFSELCATLDKMLDRDRAEGRSTDMLLSYVHRVGGYHHDYFTMMQPAGEPRHERIQVEAKPDPLAALRAKVEDSATSDNERAVLAAALEIMTASE